MEAMSFSGDYFPGKSNQFIRFTPLMCKSYVNSKNSFRDARTPQPGEIVFNTMGYRSSETVHRLGYFQSTACKN